MLKYAYDAWGNHKVLDLDGEEIEDKENIGHVNPIRYRSYYYDADFGFYYLNTRYYDPRIGRFINMDDTAFLAPDVINGLNLYAYCNNNPVMNVDPNGTDWWHWLISGLEIAAGIILVATGVGAGLGASLIVGGTLGMVGNIVGNQIAGGLASMANGWGAISTGLSLFSYGLGGAIAGGIMVAFGAGTMVFGVNEVAEGITGTNYIQEWTGISDSLYNGLYFGLNVASSIGTIAGRLGMREASTFDGHVAGKAKPYSRITDGYKTVQYDGHGKLYWSIHRSSHGKSWISNPHWHTGAGGDGNHFNSYIKLLINLIFRR